jgi:hypothetical protein
MAVTLAEIETGGAVAPAGDSPAGDQRFDRLPAVDLSQLAEAAHTVAAVESDLAARGGNVVARLLADADGFYEWEHYPPGDAYDAASASQYFYHAHPADQRFPGEHGHFHTFLRPAGLAAGWHPGGAPPPATLTHLIGVSVGRSGRAERLFTVNRWVTGEQWYPAEAVLRMLPAFQLAGASPAVEVNRWITALLRLFRGEIARLLHERDAALAEGGQGRVSDAVLDDRTLEVTSAIEIDVPARVQAVQAAAARRGF